ncbi:imidazolonepropionase [Fulvivirga sp. M361]|uniref:imidazolonepropionase n=1 Tax=Fulvivirga sp. M361 TaxID=2594266 RepID=UPI00117BD2C9|nr:imidazolonepropionase [Fulvivirga sp. M361]TRX54793.1 imidazolonepropionase [Fulvivirga sp. M361]
MKHIFKNIKELIQVREGPVSALVGEELKRLPTLKNAYLLIEDGIIADYGTMDNCPDVAVDRTEDATGKMILPAWCDSHTHLVYAGNREGEFIDRINGMTYEEIANRGGGILNSAKTLQKTSEEELYQQSKVRLEEVIGSGTGAIEIKSGYGLTMDAELKMLRVIQRLKENYTIPIKATFLAAHALPDQYSSDKRAFLRLMLEEVLPIVAKERLADYIDVFCEEGYFSVEDTELVLEAGKKFGLTPKIHVNQFNAIGGVQAGIKYDALSVDHLELIRKEDIASLQNSATMPVALPGCSYFLGIPYTPAREIIDSGLPLALASDFNPGSAPSGNMHFVVSAACIKMKMSPEEAINAATINGAYAMGLENEVGSISKGKKANLLLTKPINSYGVLAYAFGTNHLDQVYLAGEKWN